MKPIILATFGSLGDLYPYLSLALELRKLGLSVAIATDNWHRETVEKEQIDFIAVRPEVSKLVLTDSRFMAKAMNAQTGSEFIVRELVVKYVRESFEDFLYVSKGASLLVTHPLTFGAVMAAEKNQIPWVSSVLAPLSMFSKYDMPSMPNAQWTSGLNSWGPLFTGFLISQMKRETKGWFKPLIDLRKEFNLSAMAEHPLFEGQFSPALNLAMFSKVLAEPTPDWPRNTLVCGFPFYDRHCCSPEEIERLNAFLLSGDAPVSFTLGSSAVWDSGDFYDYSVKACLRLGRRALLLAGSEKSAMLKKKYPMPEVAVFDYLPHSLVFPSSCAVVHQSGIGTSAQALRAGAPQLIVPFAHDQPDNARRLENLGVANVVQRGQLSEGRIYEQLNSLLANSAKSTQAKIVAHVVESEGGAKTAALAVEQLIRTS